MGIENLGVSPQEQDSGLNEAGKEALEDLKEALAGLNVPSEEQTIYIEKFLSQAKGEGNEDVIDAAMGNIILEATQERQKWQKWVDETYKTQERTPGEEDEKERICVECKKPIRLNSKFCSWCGTKLPPLSDATEPRKICVACKTICRASSKFCHKCGNPFG